MVESFINTNRSPALIRNPDFQGIGAGQRATARIPVGPTLLISYLTFTKNAGVAMSEAEIIASVDEVRLTIDADTKVQMSMAQLIAQDRFYQGNTIIANGVVPLYFERPWMFEIQNQDAPAYGLADANSANIEISQSAGSVITGIKMEHEQVAGEPLGTHTVYLRQVYNFSAAGLLEITDIPRDSLYALFAAQVFIDKTKVDRVEILADNIQILDATVAEIEARYLNITAGKRTPQAGLLSLDFAYRGRGADVLPLNMQDFRVRLYLNAAPTGNIVPIVYEQVRVAPIKGKPA
jgi:hypothetical protein